MAPAGLLVVLARGRLPSPCRAARSLNRAKKAAGRSLLIFKGRQQHAQPAPLLELGEPYILLDCVDLGLAGADGDRRDAVLVQPVGIEAAVREQKGRLDPQHLERLYGSLHDRSILVELERRVGRLVPERHFRRNALVVRHGGLRRREGFLVAVGDLRREGGFGTARLALDEHVVRDDVRRVTAGLPSFPPKMPTLLVPRPSDLTTLPNQPALLASASATAPTMVAEMPFSGATPACDARPLISTSQFSWPTAPIMSSEASWPSTLMHMAGPLRSAEFSSRAPCSPLSSRTVNRKVIGGCGSLCLMRVSATATSSATPVRASPPSAVVPSETILSPSRRGLAPAQSGTVSRWEENKRRGPDRVPSSSAIRLPVSVGTGMRMLASSKRIADAGTPTSFSASLTAAAMLASCPVTPSTERKRIRCASAAATSRGTEVLVIVSMAGHPIVRQQLRFES